MSKTINLDIPRTAEERLAREEASIWGLIKRIEARASDGRFYHFEDNDREKAITYLKGYAKTHSKVLSDVRDLQTPNELRKQNAETFAAPQKTLSESLSDESTQLRRRMNYAVRGSGPLSMDEAIALSSAGTHARAQMLGLVPAAKLALNYIENTESELGIQLTCGDALRDALSHLRTEPAQTTEQSNG